jgi:aryl-alcohol dehydrogenase-like predicted oxidoreductase
LWASEKHSLESFVSIQPEYSPLAPTRASFERELAPVCLEYGIGVIPYSPLAGGFLTGKYQRDQALPESLRAAETANRRMTDQNWAILEAVQEVAKRHNSTPTRITLAWLLAQPFMTSPIIGANNTTQLEDSMGAIEVKLSSEEIAAISKAADWTRSRTDLEA